MTRDDILEGGRFRICYTRLCASGFRGGRKFDANTCMTYYEILEPLPIEAVEAAAVRLRTQGSIDGWFPGTPEWYQVASEEAVALSVTRIPAHRRLLPSPEVVEADLKPIRLAKAKLLRELRAKGFRGAARFIAAVPVRHPSEDTAPHWCGVCQDSGKVSVSRGDLSCAEECACVDTNPVIRHRRLRARHQQLIRDRLNRAMEMNQAKVLTS